MQRLSHLVACLTSSFLLSLAACGPDQNNISSSPGADGAPSGPDNVLTINKYPESEMAQMLQGRWRSLEDTTSYLVFQENFMRWEASGPEEWDKEEFVLGGSCQNSLDRDRGREPESNRYISCLESDMCWYIIDVTADRLELSYVGRGNTLSYSRVK